MRGALDASGSGVLPAKERAATKCPFFFFLGYRTRLSLPLLKETFRPVKKISLKICPVSDGNVREEKRRPGK